MTFSRTDDCLTSFDSETLDSDLDMFISKLGLDTAIADKFAKTNSVKIIDKDVKQESDTNKNITIKDKNTTNVPSCNLLGKSLETGSLFEYSWTMFTRTILLNYIQKTMKFTSTW